MKILGSARRLCHRVRERFLPYSTLENLNNTEALDLQRLSFSNYDLELGRLKGGIFATWPYRLSKDSIRDGTQIYSRSGRLVAIEGSDFQAQKHSQECLSYLQQAGDQSAHLDEGQYGFAVEPWFGNFYHWLVFCAPRIAILHRFAGISHFYFPRSALQQGSYIAETLVMLGMGEDSIVEVDSWRRCQSLHFVQGYRPSRLGFQLLKHCLSETINCQKLSDSPVGYYLMRRSCASHARTVENEDGLIAFCSANGITPLDPATLSLPVQAQLFSKAKILIGAHGAALANMAWMPPNSFVLEMMHEKAPHYRLLAQQLGIRYLGIESHLPKGSAAGKTHLVVNQQIFKEIIAMELALLSHGAA